MKRPRSDSTTTTITVGADDQRRNLQQPDHRAILSFGAAHTRRIAKTTPRVADSRNGDRLAVHREVRRVPGRLRNRDVLKYHDGGRAGDRVYLNETTGQTGAATAWLPRGLDDSRRISSAFRLFDHRHSATLRTQILEQRWRGSGQNTGPHS